ncbi:MAG: peptidase [Pseudomonadota bacterium]
MKSISLAAYERPLKSATVVLGLGSTFAVVQGWQLAAMTLSLPFCLIWMYFAWLRREPQLKVINAVFSVLYVYGIMRYLVIGESF